MEITELVHVGEHLIRFAQIVALPSEDVSNMNPTGTIQAETAVQRHKDAAGRFNRQISPHSVPDMATKALPIRRGAEDPNAKLSP